MHHRVARNPRERVDRSLSREAEGHLLVGEDHHAAGARRRREHLGSELRAQIEVGAVGRSEPFGRQGREHAGHVAGRYETAKQALSEAAVDHDLHLRVGRVGQVRLDELELRGDAFSALTV